MDENVTQEVQQPQKPRRVIDILLLVGLLIALGLSGYVFYLTILSPIENEIVVLRDKNNSLGVENTITEEQDAGLVKVTEVNDSDDWKTYISESTGFQVEYPPNWGIKEQFYEESSNFLEIISPSALKTPDGTHYQGPVMRITVPGEDNRDYYKANNIKETKTIVAGLEVYETDWIESLGSYKNFNRYKEPTFNISISRTKSLEQKDEENLQFDILETLKLTN